MLLEYKTLVRSYFAPWVLIVSALACIPINIGTFFTLVVADRVGFFSGEYQIAAIRVSMVLMTLFPSIGFTCSLIALGSKPKKLFLAVMGAFALIVHSGMLLWICWYWIFGRY